MADNTTWGMTNYEWGQLALGIINAITAGYSAYETHEDSKKARQIQRDAQAAAQAEQAEADRKAEMQRLEGLATNQTATDYSNIWGVNTAKYADAAQKLSAGTGSFNTDDDEENPFYTRGLI